MPLFTRTFTIIAGLLSVPVFGAPIIAANYASPFLHHLADIVNGSQTTVVVSTNAPNWSVGTPLPIIQGVSASTSTAGTLAVSTTWYFEVSAIDVNGGTTTVSSSASASTDPTDTTQSILVTWGAVPGAHAYAIYFATSSPSSFTQYFYATTTGQYLMGTTTGSLGGSYTKADTTAFSTLINPTGPSYIEGANGNATSTVASTTAFEINGGVRAQSNGTTTACYAQTAGVIFYNTANNHEWGCSGTSWQKIF